MNFTEEDARKISNLIHEKLYEENGSVKITCAHALEIAHKIKTTPTYIGKLCNDLGIKISSCQLGCFK